MLGIILLIVAVVYILWLTYEAITAPDDPNDDKTKKKTS